MKVRMEPDEEDLFRAFLCRARSYVEFGSGGSTVAAAELVQGPITTLDSSQDWLDRVAAACAALPAPVKPQLVFADIGPTGDWGRPVDESCRDRWPGYARAIWPLAGTEVADLYLVDGRFRVSCAAETMLRCRPDAIMLIHDFADRPHYHVVREMAREVAKARTLSAFVRRADFNPDRAQEILRKMLFVPD